MLRLSRDEFQELAALAGIQEDWSKEKPGFFKALAERLGDDLLAGNNLLQGMRKLR